jgi:hypothetical protein
VGNNPVNFNDPTGHKECDPEFGCEGKLPKPLPKPEPKPDDDDIVKPPANPQTFIGPSIYGSGLIGPPVPSEWNLNPNSPDYRTTVINGYFVVIQITQDRYQKSYLSFGGSTSLFGISYINGAIGSPFDTEIPSLSESQEFLTGISINLTGSVFFGVGATGSPGVLIEHGLTSDPKPYATEAGFHLTYPSVTLTGVWSFALP